jgi:AGCS family alanine or glycine:cation symporter
VQVLDTFWAAAVDLVWGLPLVALLVGGGAAFTLISGLIPFRRLPHALGILRGRYDDPDDPGEITHFQALSSALSATIGMGNIAGVAIAVSMGGPGAIFWMWVAGFLGMATKFFTCTLSCLYRKTDSRGIAQGGPMYFIECGLGPRWKPLAMMFAACGMIGCLPLFQVNQLSGLLESHLDVPRLATGIAALLFVGTVILGGITRVGKVAERIVPGMFLLYLAASVVIIARHLPEVPGVFASIFGSAFTGHAATGGAAGFTFRQVLITGIRRAAFSNEAGMGTAPMAHGAARTKEPVREGLIAMLGPFLDTNLVCTLTALVILSTGAGTAEGDGVIMTARAFEDGLGPMGPSILTLIVVLFAMTTITSYSYYSQKCAKYLVGDRWGERFVFVYLAALPLGALWTQDLVINMLDTAFALMAIPTMIAALVMAPRVMAATRDYFARMRV